MAQIDLSWCFRWCPYRDTGMCLGQNGDDICYPADWNDEERREYGPHY